VDGADDEETPYVEMTRRMLEIFPNAGGEFQVEPDASSGSYFIAARALGHSVEVHHWPNSGMQVDGEFPWFLPLPAAISRTTDLGDSIMTAIVLAPFADQPVRFTNLGRLRVQECERVAALRTELTKCGARVEEEGDCLTVYPSILHGAEIETYHDHRMAMCFAVVGVAIPGITILDPSCVRKTFPNFFEKLAAPQPGGLGLRIFGTRGEHLTGSDLSAV
jgi:3-phosphoshikimate 1-carboxyvinyltransferase